MKKISALLLIMAAGFFSAVSCQKEDLSPFDITLQADKETITVDQYNDAVAFNLSWNEVSAGETAPRYFVEFSDDSDPEFMSSIVFEQKETTSMAVTFKDMETIHNAIGAVSDYNLVARMRVEGADYAQSISNQVKIAVTLNLLPTFDELYLCGEGCDAGWSLGQLPMTNNDGVFTWTGHLWPTESGRGFRFNTTDDNWAPCLVLALGEDDRLVYSADAVYEYIGDGAGEPDPATQEVRVDKDGTYTVTIDATDLKNITLDVTLVE